MAPSSPVEDRMDISSEPLHPPDSVSTDTRPGPSRQRSVPQKRRMADDSNPSGQGSSDTEKKRPIIPLKKRKKRAADDILFIKKVFLMVLLEGFLA